MSKEMIAGKVAKLAQKFDQEAQADRSVREYLSNMQNSTKQLMGMHSRQWALNTDLSDPENRGKAVTEDQQKRVREYREKVLTDIKAVNKAASDHAINRAFVEVFPLDCFADPAKQMDMLREALFKVPVEQRSKAAVLESFWTVLNEKCGTEYEWQERFLDLL